MNVELAKSIIEAFTGQIDLTTSFSLALLAGYSAFHLNGKLGSAARKGLKGLVWSRMAIGSCSISLLIGYVAKGAVTAAIPRLMTYDYSSLAFASMHIDDILQKIEYSHLSVLAALQAVLFVVGVLMTIVFAIQNQRTIGV